MSTWMVTFGQKYATEEHPYFPQADPDGWIEIEAGDYTAARQVAVAFLGRYWSDLYDAVEFATARERFPFGCLGRIALVAVDAESVEQPAVEQRPFARAAERRAEAAMATLAAADDTEDPDEYDALVESARRDLAAARELGEWQRRMDRAEFAASGVTIGGDR